MTAGETVAFATRLRAEEAELIKEAVDQAGISRSELLAFGFRYYMDKNPDNIPAFRPEGQDLCYLEEAGILTRRNEQEWTRISDQ